MSTKRKNREEAALSVYWANRMAIPIIFVASISLVYFFSFSKRDASEQEFQVKERSWRIELDWPSDTITASPSHTKRFIGARLEHISEKLPTSAYHILAGSKSVKQFLQDFLASGELDTALSIIIQGRDALKKGGSLSLTLLPDDHPHIEEEQSETSQAQQLKIRDLIRKARPALVFAEGMSGELTWQNLHKDMLRTSQDFGVQAPVFLGTTNEFKQWWLGQDAVTFWWGSFLDQKTPVIVGIDQLALNRVVLILDSLDDPVLPPEAYHNTVMWLNYTYRDQVILARAILEMRSRELTEAYIVLGSTHTGTLGGACEDWGVKFIAMPL